MASQLPSLIELAVERSAELLERYRVLVRLAASGVRLETAQVEAAEKLLDLLELPTSCFRRDVSALLAMRAAQNESRRLELAWVYPHLFGNATRWSEMRRSDRAARRRALADLREAMAVEI